MPTQTTRTLTDLVVWLVRGEQKMLNCKNTMTTHSWRSGSERLIWSNYLPIALILISAYQRRIISFVQ